jgi:hypothetical protein
MENDRFREIIVRQLRHPCPRNPVLLAASRAAVLAIVLEALIRIGKRSLNKRPRIDAGEPRCVERELFSSSARRF